MVFVLLTYGGWNEAAYVSAEVRGGPRAVLRTLMLSIAIITLSICCSSSACCMASASKR